MLQLRRLLICLPILAFSSFGLAQAESRPEPPPWFKIGLDAGIDWIRDPEPFYDGKRIKRNLIEKVDRNALLERAIAEAKAKDRPILWYVYRIVEDSKRGVQMYRAPVLDIYMQHVLFADPEVTGIVKNRFVTLRMVYDETMAKRFDLRPLDFIEPAIIFLGKDGKMVHHVNRIRTFHAEWFAHLLRRVLKAAGDQPPAAGLNPAQLTAQGHWEQALAALRKEPEPRSTDSIVLESRLNRLLHRFDDAVGGLHRITRGEEHHRIELETAHAALARGEAAEAYGLLTSCLQNAPAPARDGRAAYLRLLAATQLGLRGIDDDKLAELLRSARAEGERTIWGKKADVNMMTGEDKQPVGPTLLGFESTARLPAAAYEGLPTDTSWPGDPQQPEALIRGAVEFLLRQQRTDGGFRDARYAYWPSPAITRNTWAAITALCAQALMRHRHRFDGDTPRDRHLREWIDAAIAKARAYVLDDKNIDRGVNEDVYVDAYRLQMLVAECDGKSPEQKAALLQTMQTIIKASHERQKPTGFWAHEYPNAFCTGAMLWSLRQAHLAGAAVPDSMFEGGIKALLSARHSNGAYIYGGSVNPKSRRVISRKNAAGRMPLCEGILFAFGKSDKPRLMSAFDAFFEHLDSLERVRRNDFHSDGELAGFFFFHAIYHTSQANSLLDEAQRLENNKKLLSLLLRIPEMDGSFLDSHEFGRSYGTAMALLTFANVLTEKDR